MFDHIMSSFILINSDFYFFSEKMPTASTDFTHRASNINSTGSSSKQNPTNEDSPASPTPSTSNSESDSSNEPGSNLSLDYPCDDTLKLLNDIRVQQVQIKRYMTEHQVAQREILEDMKKILNFVKIRNQQNNELYASYNLNYDHEITNNSSEFDELSLNGLSENEIEPDDEE